MGLFSSNDAVIKNEPETEEAQEINVAQDTKIRQPFAYWSVGGNQLRLKLRIQDILELESRYKTNLMNLMGSENGGMPSMTVMLDITQAALAPWNHGIKKTDVENLFSQYMLEGGSQLSFYTSVYMKIFGVSGFFSENLASQMNDKLEKAEDI